jgi:hypothetical protein
MWLFFIDLRIVAIICQLKFGLFMLPRLEVKNLEHLSGIEE